MIFRVLVFLLVAAAVTQRKRSANPVFNSMIGLGTMSS